LGFGTAHRVALSRALIVVPVAGQVGKAHEIAERDQSWWSDRFGAAYGLALSQCFLSFYATV
jgi:hypothetical protein